MIRANKPPSTPKFTVNFANLIVPALIVFLIIMAFAIGMLYTKLQYLENKSNLVTPPIGQPQAQPPAPTLTSEQLTSLASKGFSRGASDSKVVIIEFADYQCPFCARYFSQVEQPLLKDYVNSGKARFVFRD